MNRVYFEASPPLLREYLGYIETVKGRSAKTADGYFIDLRTFFRYLKRQRGMAPSDVDDKNIDISDVGLSLLQSVTLLDVFGFLNYTKSERQNNNATRSRKTVALRMFFRYLTDYSHVLDVNPIQNLETPKIKKSLPKYLSLDQSKQLLAAAGGAHVLRDYCMLTLLLNCGLRRAEISALNVKDIHSDRSMRVLGKGGKERILYLNDACWNAVQRYLQEGRKRDGIENKHRDALFLSRNRQRISLQGIHYIVKNYLKQVDGAEGYSTHKLRHTAATLMYQYGGADIRVLQDILGHANLGTTEIYTHLSDEQVKRAAENNPLAGEKR